MRLLGRATAVTGRVIKPAASFPGIPFRFPYSAHLFPNSSATCTTSGDPFLLIKDTCIPNDPAGIRETSSSSGLSGTRQASLSYDGQLMVKFDVPTGGEMVHENRTEVSASMICLRVSWNVMS